MTKKIVIPDKIFHKLWDYACEYDSLDEFYSAINTSSSKSYINLQKYNISVSQLYDVIKAIYDAAHYSIKDIIKDFHFTKASFSHRFCVPIRTVENWCARTNKCPGYTRLLFLEALEFQILPNNIYIESKCQIEKNDKRRRNMQRAVKTTVSGNVMLEDVDLEDNFPMPSFNDDYMNFSVRDWEQTHSNSDSSDILAKTDYLSDILKRRSRQFGDDC